jgi:hypothetical protein
MKGLEEAPMRAMEERVSDAFVAAAETVTARDLPGPPTWAGRVGAARGLRAWAARARMHALVPAAAAAGVTVIIVAAALVVPKLLAGPPGARAAALAGAPRFFAGVAVNPAGHYPPRTVVNIYRSATGRVVASVRLPRHLRMFAAVSRLGSDRTYAAAAITGNGCTTRLYRFTIDSRGRPSGLTPLSVPQVTGSVGELVGSADGNVLAYRASGPCAPRGRTPVGMIRLATRQVTTWTFQSARPRWFNGHKYWTSYATVGSVSLTADGSVLGFLAGPDRRYGPQDVWVLPTSSPPGSLTRHARKVLHLRTGVFRVLLNKSGSQAYVETQSAPRGGAVILGLYSTSTGRRIRLLGRLGPGGRNLAELPVTVDAAGRHLLAYGYLGSSRVMVMNLTTGRRASTTAAHLVVEGALTTVAW